MSTTTLANRINEVADDVLGIVARTQQLVIDQVNAAGERVSASVDLPDSLPFADAVGSPSEYVQQGFAIAGRVIEMQRDFVLKLAAAVEGVVTEPADN